MSELDQRDGVFAQSFDHEKVDLKAKQTENGEDFTAINPKRYVPELFRETEFGEISAGNVDPIAASCEGCVHGATT